MALTVLGCGAEAARPAATAPRSAAEVCQPPATAEKAGGTLTFTWTADVEIDHPDGSVLLFSSGADALLCQVGRAPDGSFWAVTTGLGRDPAGSPTAVTLDTGMTMQQGLPVILAGRVPPGTASVRLTFGDGTQQLAMVGNGHWLAWPSASAAATRIEALDAAGTVLGSLADPNGVPFSG